MNTIKNNISVFIILNILILNNIVLAQTAENKVDSTLKAFQIKPILEITTYESNYYVNSQISMHMRVINLLDRDLFLDSVKILLPGEYLIARNETPQEINNFAKMDLESFQLIPGNEFIFDIIIPYRDIPWYDDVLNFRLLTFQTKKYEFVITLWYSKVLNKRPTIAQHSKTLEISPTPSSIVWGGILGSFLLAIFLGAYKFSRNIEPNKPKDIIVEAVKLFVAGAISAVILVTLLFRMKDLALPINITVNDFYGGIVLGLFTYTLGDWLYKKLREGDKE